MSGIQVLKRLSAKGLNQIMYSTFSYPFVFAAALGTFALLLYNVLYFSLIIASYHDDMMMILLFTRLPLLKSLFFAFFNGMTRIFAISFVCRLYHKFYLSLVVYMVRYHTQKLFHQVVVRKGNKNQPDFVGDDN